MGSVTNDIYLNRVRDKFGDKLDLSLVEYTKMRNNVTVICKEHGEFKIKAYQLLNSVHGCKDCAYKARSIRLTYTAEHIKEKITSKFPKLLFEDIISYTDKIKFTCPRHGDFISSPKGVVDSMYGCSKCANKEGSKKITLSKEGVISQFKSKHGEQYDYSKVDYKNDRTNIIVTCKKHGDFIVTPNDHKYGSGCNDCHSRKKSDKFYLNHFRTEGNKELEYISVNKGDVTFICKNHGEVKQLVSSHKRLYRCPTCGNESKGNYTRTSFTEASKKTGKAVFYIVNLFSETESFVKFGITTKGIEDRFKRIPYKYKVISSYEGTPEEVFNLEKAYLRNNLTNKYKPNKKFGGMTETIKTLLTVSE
jgi:hypothetical protein